MLLTGRSTTVRARSIAYDSLAIVHRIGLVDDSEVVGAGATIDVFLRRGTVVGEYLIVSVAAAHRVGAGTADQGIVAEITVQRIAFATTVYDVVPGSAVYGVLIAAATHVVVAPQSPNCVVTAIDEDEIS